MSFFLPPQSSSSPAGSKPLTPFLLYLDEIILICQDGKNITTLPPTPENIERYENKYKEFIDLLKKKDYSLDEAFQKLRINLLLLLICNFKSLSDLVDKLHHIREIEYAKL